MKNVQRNYYRWICKMVGDEFGAFTHKKTLELLHSIEFRWLLPRDEHRAEDGVSLRYRYAVDKGFDKTPAELAGKCSVLEMLAALALRAEENFLADDAYGDRTGEWFWKMLTTMGIGRYSDDRFDKAKVEDAVQRFLDREYEPDGKGGLFIIKNPEKDLRDVEIWYQLLWWINTFI